MERPEQEKKKCPECFEKTHVDELESFNGYCEQCYEEMNNIYGS